MGGFVRVEREGACAWVTLDRPPLNLIVPEMVEGIRSAFEEGETDQAREADLPQLDEAGAGAGRLAVSEMRVIGESPGSSQDQEKPTGK